LGQDRTGLINGALGSAEEGLFMKITVLGSGSVGLSIGTCLATLGHDTWCVELSDTTADSVGPIPWEPGLNELLMAAINDSRIHFTTDLAGAIQQAEVTFIATENRNDLSAFWKAVDRLAHQYQPSQVIVILGEVPLGTTEAVQAHLGTNSEVVHQASFAKPGTLISDFLQPQRLVIGASPSFCRHMLSSLYQPLPVSIEWTEPAESEWIQYADNAFRAIQRFNNQPQRHTRKQHSWIHPEPASSVAPING
jgi:UDPglucose 6-dehydrogenase